METQAVGMAAYIQPIIMLVLMVAIFYFILIRPQRKRDKQFKELLANLQVGDIVPQELPFGLKQVKETDDEFSQTLHAGSYLYWRNNQESAQPAPKATSRLVTGFRRTCSPTCSMPALPAS